MDWTHAPLHPTAWASAAERAPDTGVLVEGAIAQSGIEGSRVDRLRAADLVRQSLVRVGKDVLRRTGNAAGADALTLVARRPDLSDTLLWNFFTHLGANGVVVRNHLIGSYLCGGAVTTLLVEAIRDGSLLREVPVRDPHRAGPPGDVLGEPG